MGIRLAGLNIPVFSLRSKKSLGCGEFLDLIPLIDWAKEAGLKIIQLLPIHDTSITQSHEDGLPYAILSSFSLHPIYINIQALAPDLQREIIDPLVKRLNLPKFDYEKTYLAKMELFKLLYVLRGEKDLATKSFQTFFSKNREHLRPYAAFCVLRDHFKTSDFTKWQSYSKYSTLLVEEVEETFDTRFYYFIQYHLDSQLTEVKEYAKKAKVLLKGDFTMGVHAQSVDAWRFAEYFRWDKTIGAPPDFYNNIGQNWGFPSYDWEEIEDDNFYWLKERLKWMEQYFDAVRIDHVLGYFRLWEIPAKEVRGLMGTFFPSEGYTEEELASWGFEKPYGSFLPVNYANQREVLKNVRELPERNKLYKQIENRLFYQREGRYHPRAEIDKCAAYRELDSQQKEKALAISDDYFLIRQQKLWENSGREKLAIIQNHTSMIICVEDIGHLPQSIEKVVKEQKMLNLHVQRMPKNVNLKYEDPKDFPETCVCMPSNHDTSPLREWWEENLEETRLYYHAILKHEGNPPKELTEQIAKEIIQAHLNSNARMAIFLLQDLLAMSAELKFPIATNTRINDPSKPFGQWQWRSHIYVEELNLAHSFTKLIKEMVSEAKR